MLLQSSSDVSILSGIYNETADNKMQYGILTAFNELFCCLGY